MQEITEEIKNWVILKHNGIAEFITEKQAEFITQSMAQGAKGIKRGVAGWLAFSSISDIVSIEKYYEMYPDKRPVETRNNFIDIYGLQGNQQIRQPTQKAVELMKKGFLKYHREQGRTEQEAEEKWQDLKKAGINFNLLKKHKYRL